MTPERRELIIALDKVRASCNPVAWAEFVNSFHNYFSKSLINLVSTEDKLENLQGQCQAYADIDTLIGNAMDNALKLRDK